MQAIYNLVSGLAIAVLAINGFNDFSRYKEQQRQIDEFSDTIMGFLRSQKMCYETNMLVSGAKYDVVFVNYKRGFAVLKATTDDEIRYEIHSGVYPEILEDWSKNRHLRW